MARRPHPQKPLWIASLLVAAVAAAVGSALAAGGAGTAAVSAKPQWVPRDLGTLGGESSSADAINDRGQVVGTADTKTGSHAFLWEKGRMRDLGVSFGGPGSWASAINERGQVVGLADTNAIAESGHHVTHAFLWEKGKVTDLGALGAGESSSADAINERGQVVGTSCRDSYRHKGCRAFLWENGEMTDLGTLNAVDLNERGQVVGTATAGTLGTNRSPIRHAFLWQRGKLIDLGTLGGQNSEPSAINDRSQVVGWADTTAKYTSGYGAGWFIRHAFLWQSGRMRDLGTLGGESSSADAIEYSIAEAINERGQVVGTASRTTGSHAFLWSKGRMRDLGTLGGLNSEPSAINERGQVVGWAATTTKNANGMTIWHAFLWQNGKMTDLGTLGRQSRAVAVNERGQIIGWSKTKSGAVHAVLWTASRRR